MTGRQQKVNICLSDLKGRHQQFEALVGHLRIVGNVYIAEVELHRLVDVCRRGVVGGGPSQLLQVVLKLGLFHLELV